MLEYADKPDYAMISGIFERTMKRRGVGGVGHMFAACFAMYTTCCLVATSLTVPAQVRESDPFDWEKAGSDRWEGCGL